MAPKTGENEARGCGIVGLLVAVGVLVKAINDGWLGELLLVLLALVGLGLLFNVLRRQRFWTPGFLRGVRTVSAVGFSALIGLAAGEKLGALAGILVFAVLAALLVAISEIATVSKAGGSLFADRPGRAGRFAAFVSGLLFAFLGSALPLGLVLNESGMLFEPALDDLLAMVVFSGAFLVIGVSLLLYSLGRTRFIQKLNRRRELPEDVTGLADLVSDLRQPDTDPLD